MNDSSVSPRRPRSNPAERARWAQRFFQSGLPPRQFALRHGLRLSTLQRWARQNPAAPSPPDFAELKLPASGASASRWTAEFVRADGLVVRLAHDAPGAWLEQLLRAC